MKQKPPITRAISFLSQEAGLSGTLYAHDYEDGAIEHAVSGLLTDLSGNEHKFFGQLLGVGFVTRETRGAPPKTARDVALFLAYRWFLGCSKRADEADSESKARKKVMQLWADKGFKGVSEETHLRKRLNAGHQAIYGLSLMHYVCSTSDPDGAIVAAHKDVFDMRPGEYMGINGPGWFWRYGVETAENGRLSASASLTADKS